MTDSNFLIVGLGNPGAKYSGNRHSIGQMVLDELASRLSASFQTTNMQALVAEARLGVLSGGRPGPKITLAKPTTYMNVSGGPVAKLTKFYGFSSEQIIVVHDELDIPFASIKCKQGGGEGGHNGLRDISKAIATKDYLRVRVGVGRPPGRMEVSDFVLKDFNTVEKKELPFLISDAVDCVEMIISDGLLAAQGKFHSQSPAS